MRSPKIQPKSAVFQVPCISPFLEAFDDKIAVVNLYDEILILDKNSQKTFKEFFGISCMTPLGRKNLYWM